MDDVDEDFQARNKADIVAKLEKAVLDGVYPGWENDRTKDYSRRGAQVPEVLQPLPCSGSAKQEASAARALGRQFVVNFWDDLLHMDLHSSVSGNVIYTCTAEALTTVHEALKH
jgi:hypothetical protein